MGLVVQNDVLPVITHLPGRLHGYVTVKMLHRQIWHVQLAFNELITTRAVHGSGVLSATDCLTG